MTFKQPVTNEILLEETPEKFQKVVEEKLGGDKDSKLRKITKKIEYPYIDKSKELIVYKAYITSFNLMTLVSQFGFSDNVNVDSMVVGDCKKFIEYWNELNID